jgi:vacuolar protein sorting-associated protein 45
MFANFGEIAAAIKKELEDYASQNQSSQNLESIEQMQKVLESLPEMKKKSANLNKHLNIISELSRIIKARQLTDISRLEQFICSKDNKSDQLKELNDILEKPFDKYDKLKLAIIFCIRYENDKNTISSVKKKLLTEGISLVCIDYNHHHHIGND